MVAFPTALLLTVLLGCGAFTTAPKPPQRVQGPGCTITTRKGFVVLAQHFAVCPTGGYDTTATVTVVPDSTEVP
jgi:hypothetical protein